MADPNNKLSRALEGFELLLAAATALVRAKSSRPALFVAYDDASDRLSRSFSEEAAERAERAVDPRGVHVEVRH
jgi:hypothetical protein